MDDILKLTKCLLEWKGECSLNKVDNTHWCDDYNGHVCDHECACDAVLPKTVKES